MASITYIKTQNAWQDIMVAHGIFPSCRSLRKENSLGFSLGCFSFNGGGFLEFLTVIPFDIFS